MAREDIQQLTYQKCTYFVSFIFLLFCLLVISVPHTTVFCIKLKNLTRWHLGETLNWNICLVRFSRCTFDLVSKCHSSWQSHGGSWLTTWGSVWFWPPEHNMDGERVSPSHSGVATMLGGLVSFQKVRKVFTASTCVQANLERLFPGGGEINDKSELLWLTTPRIQITFGFKHVITSFRLCANSSNH